MYIINIPGGIEKNVRRKRGREESEERRERKVVEGRWDRREGEKTRQSEMEEREQGERKVEI